MYIHSTKRVGEKRSYYEMYGKKNQSNLHEPNETTVIGVHICFLKKVTRQ